MTDVWTLHRGAPGYPEALLDLDDLRDHVSPERLHGRGDIGLLAALEPGRTVTVVGARRSSAYGRSVAAELAGSLAAAGLVVVSGMAYGIDTAAHRGALDAGGATVAVLACGPDRVYPPSARSLYRRIVRDGALVSESEPGYEPGRWDFPKRNRIMAALAGMTVLVEARDPSGSRITADCALDLGRGVGGVPGIVGSPLSEGPHALIRDGATLVRGPQDVLDHLLGVGVRVASRIGPELDAECARVLEAVGATGAAMAGVASGAGLDPARAAVALARLELTGYVTADAGRYSRTGLVPP
jgi:DNA processing protein